MNNEQFENETKFTIASKIIFGNELKKVQNLREEN